MRLTKELPPILSERLIKKSELKERENVSAVKIQKVYRGYRVRKYLKKQLQNTAELENEYEKWKKKRIHAAVAIQSSWRGYAVRRELQKEQEDQENMIQDPFWETESPPGMLVINIGRTPSEIERANQKYDYCSMIQTVFRASKLRRKMHMKLAVRRGKKSDSANIIHAVFRGFKNRIERKHQLSITNIQKTVKGFMARERMQDRILMKIKAQHTAATILQASHKAHVRRAKNEAEKEARRKLAEAHQAAVSIQSAFRGFYVRNELEETKTVLQREAAIKIQAGVVGYKERVTMKNRRLAATRLTAAYRSYRRRNEVKLFKEKMEMERFASTRLQSAFKSYKRRVLQRLHVEKMKRERNAATRMQSAFRSYKRRVQQRLYNIKMEKRKAATRLQSFYKSYNKRCENRAFKDLVIRRNKYADIIQSSARGHITRVQFKLLKELNCKREEASIKIQSVFRGFKDRRSVKQLRHLVEVNNAAKEIIEVLIDRTTAYIRQRSKSAERIQASVKGYKTREKMNIERQRRKVKRNHYASKIQAVVRAEQGRAWNEQMRILAEKNASATKIQSLYRGYSTRKELARERAMIAELDPPFISARTRSGRLLALSLDGVLMSNARAMILFHKKASDLQAAFRAHRVRQETLDRLYLKQKIIDMTPRREKSTRLLNKEDRAAIIIQKVWRGYSDRKAYQILITSKRKIWNAAASVIQASVRGYESRKEGRMQKERLKNLGKEESVKKRKEAADVISYAFRALRRRNEKVALRAEM